MRNGAPRVCHVVFKLKICFFPLVFCEESTSGCVILSPHYNASFITVFQPLVYSLISWLSGCKFMISPCVSSFVIRTVSNGITQIHIAPCATPLCRMLLQTGRESCAQFVRVLQVGLLLSFRCFHASRILLETCGYCQLWGSRPHIKAYFYLFFFLVMDDSQSKSQNYCQDKCYPVFFFPPTFTHIISDLPQAVMCLIYQFSSFRDKVAVRFCKSISEP